MTQLTRFFNPTINRKMKFCKTNTPYLFVCLFSFFVVHKAVAQQKQEILNLPQAVSLALKHYPSLQSYQAQVEAGVARVNAAKQAWLPSAQVMEEVSAGTANNLVGSYFPMGIVPATVGGVRPNTLQDIAINNVAAVMGQWELYNFGAYQANTNEAKAALGIKNAALDKEKYLIQSQVITNYFELSRYYSLLMIQQKNIDRTKAVKEAIKAYVQNGLKPGVDSSVAEAELSKARLTYIELQDAYDILRSKLSLLTGLDTTAIVPDTTINTKLYGILYHQSAPDSSLSEQHPVLQYYQSVYNDQRAREKLIAKQYLPKVYFMAAGSVRGSSITPADNFEKSYLKGLSYTRYNYLTGLAITYDLFDNKRKHLKLAEQKFESRAAQKDVEAAKLVIENQVKESAIGILTALEKLREIPVQVTAAADAYHQKLALYNAGLTNIIEVTNALYVLNRAETDYVTAMANAWNALFYRAYATNTLSQLLSSLN